MSGIVGMSPNMNSGKIGVQPNGVPRKEGYVMRRDSSGQSQAGNLGGTGWQIVPFDQRSNTLGNVNDNNSYVEDWSNPITDITSNAFKLEVGVYRWHFWRATHSANHIWTYFSTYGAADGTGTSFAPGTSAGRCYGLNFKYDAGQSTIDMNLYGAVKVTSANQKYAFRSYTEANSQHGSSNVTAAADTQIIQNIARFQKVED